MNHDNVNPKCITFSHFSVSFNCIVGLSFLGLHFQNEKQIETLKMENPEVQTGINVLNRKFYTFVRQHKTRTQHHTQPHIIPQKVLQTAVM